MQIVAVTGIKKTKGCSVKMSSTVNVKKAEVETEVREPIIFGNLDDMIRVARYKVHELYYALPSAVRTILARIESDIEVLRLKGSVPTGFGIAEETPPIVSSLDELSESLHTIQGQDLTEAKKRFKFLMDEKDFVLQKNKK